MTLAERLDTSSAGEQPDVRARARAMRAAYASASDEHTRALLRGLMEHFRGWCVNRGLADPFPAPRIVRRRDLMAGVDSAPEQGRGRQYARAVQTLDA